MGGGGTHIMKEKKGTKRLRGRWVDMGKRKPREWKTKKMHFETDLGGKEY